MRAGVVASLLADIAGDYTDGFREAREGGDGSGTRPRQPSEPNVPDDCRRMIVSRSGCARTRIRVGVAAAAVPSGRVQ